jgi:hypothetical protein
LLLEGQARRELQRGEAEGGGEGERGGEEEQQRGQHGGQAAALGLRRARGGRVVVVLAGHASRLHGELESSMRWASSWLGS